MVRRIIRINEAACTGCGACAAACHEGAIRMIDGKARLTREDCCDGLGDCLPACPAGAITFEEREAPAYDGAAARAAASGRLAQWPVQLALVPVNAPFLDGADLLVAADCAAYACGDFHSAFMRGRVTLIGCPKLDAADYSEKLAQILLANRISSVTVARMEVPCCGGLVQAVRRALQASGKDIPCSVAILSADGKRRDG